MTPFLEKTIKFLGKSPNPASIEILATLLSNPEIDIRSSAFDALFLKKEPTIYVLLFRVFSKDETAWSASKSITTERLSRLADAAFRSEDAAIRSRAAEVILQYKLYETLPIVMVYLEGSDEALSRRAREMTLELAESFYNDLVAAPNETERRNLDRRREWFVQQLDGPIKRFAVHNIEEVVQAMLIVTKKDYETMRMVVSDHRSAACKKVVELLQFGDHGSYIRLLLSYVPDSGAPAVIDEILTSRSDPLFVRKLLEVVGINPNMDFKATLKRFKDFTWFDVQNAELGSMLEGLEPNAVQLLQASSMTKEKKVRLSRFFLQRPSVESRRAAAEALKRMVGDEVNALLLEFVNDDDPVTSSTIFRILKSRGVAEVDRHFDRLVQRPEEEIRKAIYDMMPELHVESFASRIGQMTSSTAKTTGRYVRLIDPNTVKVIADDLASPIPIRRLSACGVAATTGFAPEFVSRLIELADGDDETNVRIAAIAALGSVLTKEAVEVIKTFVGDRSMDIRDAANAALREWIGAYQSKMSPTE